MSKVKKVNKKDKHRILLTEVLPYEVPIIFSNEGFYEFVSNENEYKNSPTIVKDALTNNSKSKIPFNYRIKKDASSFRTLSIMHPSNQLDFVDFYQDYDLLLIHLCGKSPLTLRHPIQVASMFYEKANGEQKEGDKNAEVEVEEDPAESDEVKSHSSSYFKYSKYNFIYKFYDSYEFLRLEKRFKNLLKFDVSNCFSTIYTHSIAWAVKDKLFAKTYKDRYSFEKKFDELMQSANHRETNGIIIGPEVSRIFAEIILQAIDLSTIKRVENRGLKFKKDFEVRRYVDDYFVFSNSEEDGRLIKAAFQEELEKFKLYINKSKTTFFKAPFVSDITIARKSVVELITNFFLDFIDKYAKFVNDVESESEFRINRFQNISNKLILDLKCLIKIHNVEYNTVSRIAFSAFKSNFTKFLNKVSFGQLSERQVHNMNCFVFISFDFLFFLYSMDCCIRITYVMTQIIVSTNQKLQNAPLDVQHSFKKKVFDESILLIKKITNEEKQLSIEVLNLLIALRSLGKEYLLEESFLMNIVNINSKENILCYFRIITILWYIKDDARYKVLRERIEEYVLEMFKADTYSADKAENTCLFFDIMSCPYFEKSKKELILQCYHISIRKNQSVLKDTNTLVNYIAKRKWFVDWDENINLNFVLQKKELKTPY